MSKKMNRRTFLGQAARTAAAGAVIGNLRAFGADTPPATQPAVEWRNKQPTMSYARLGRTNFMTSRCVFGAGGLYRSGGDTRLLEVAIDRGMNYIDTGRPYANSEAAIADIARRHRDRVWIVSKAGHIGWPDMKIKPGEGSAAARLYSEQLDESLRQLNVDVIDCYMVQGVEHEWVVTMDALYEAFDKARKAGKVRYFGLATHTNVPKVCELAAETRWYDVVMLAVNPNSLASLAPAIKKMHDAGIGVISMKTSGPITRSPKAYDEQYQDMFGGQQLSPYQRAYAYMLFRGDIDAFNAHMPNRRILEENLAVPILDLSHAELDRIERQTLVESRGACRHCGDCSRACPEGINVADMLRCHAYVHNYRERSVARALYEILGKDRAHLCTSCGACRVACPESIDLAAVIASLRVELS
jgi:predicted aldo/keto reductase-like oxidoreductase